MTGEYRYRTRRLVPKLTTEEVLARSLICAIVIQTNFSALDLIVLKMSVTI